MDYFVSSDFIAGCIAGSVGIAATQPLDTIRIRMQLYKGMKKLSISGHALSIVKHEGVNSLWRGVGSPTLTCGLMSAVLFQTFESTKSLIKQYKYNYNLSNPDKSYKNIETTYTDMIIAGGIAGVVSTVITSPTELIKIEVQKSVEPGTETIAHEFRVGCNLIKNYGIFSGLYRGMSVTILRDGMAFMSYFPIYEWLMNNFDKKRETKIIPFIGGGLAGLISWFSCYPLDYIKTHYQTRNFIYGQVSLYNAIKYHIRHEPNGIRQFYNGCGATLLRATPQHAIVFLCYEKIKQFMNNNEYELDYQFNI